MPESDVLELGADFADMLRALSSAGADFLSVGAHAPAVHGVVRSTGDLDIFVRPSADNAGRVVAALGAFGAPVSAHGVSTEDFARPGTVYQLGLPPKRIDLLTKISGVEFEEAMAGAVEVTVAGIRVKVLGRPQLKANKKTTGRARDVEDLRRLQAQEG